MLLGVLFEKRPFASQKKAAELELEFFKSCPFWRGGGGIFCFRLDPELSRGSSLWIKRDSSPPFKVSPPYLAPKQPAPMKRKAEASQIVVVVKSNHPKPMRFSITDTKKSIDFLMTVKKSTRINSCQIERF